MESVLSALLMTYGMAYRANPAHQVVFIEWATTGEAHIQPQEKAKQHPRGQ